MGIIKAYYCLRHPNVRKEDIPRRYNISLWGAVMKTIRKFMSVVIIPSIPFNNLRVICYRLIGYKIGEGSFIGMRCYLDDLCYDQIEIGRNVTISYGVYFACHGRKQGHNKLIIRDGAYIGMRSSIVARTDIEIGEDAVVGAQTLVNKSVPAHTTVVGIPCRILEQK